MKQRCVKKQSNVPSHSRCHSNKKWIKLSKTQAKETKQNTIPHPMIRNKYKIGANEERNKATLTIPQPMPQAVTPLWTRVSFFSPVCGQKLLMQINMSQYLLCPWTTQQFWFSQYFSILYFMDYSPQSVAKIQIIQNHSTFLNILISLSVQQIFILFDFKISQSCI